MTRAKQDRDKNAASNDAHHQGPAPMGLHMLATANLLTAAAMPYASDPQKRAQAVRAAGELARNMMQGLEAYRASPARAQRPQHESIWQEGATRLLRVPGAQKDAVPVLLVPSLINRYGILDLDPDHSFAAFLAGQGFAPHILDWGTPQDAESMFTIDSYMQQRLAPALAHLASRYGAVHMAGYCMGGTMAAGALAAGVCNPSFVRSLVALAAPWDFQAGDAGVPLRMRAYAMCAQGVMDATGRLPVDWIQALFATVDPLFAFNKFRAFARMDPLSEEARRFVVVEDWLNDGVPLTAPAAKQALWQWYIENQPVNGVWTVGAGLADAGNIAVPALVVAAKGDRLVPEASALALARAIPDAQVMGPDIGHIGMMASTRAKAEVWEPVAGWLKRN